MSLYYNLIRSGLFKVGVVWVDRGSNAGVARIFVSGRKRDMAKKIKAFFPEAEYSRSKKARFLTGDIRRYLNGYTVRFDTSYLQKAPCSQFQRNIYIALNNIPYGKVITYKGLAERAGSGSGRPAGNALAKNLFPIIIPCHRVVRFNKEIGGFQGGMSLKRALLKLEGVDFGKNGKIPEKFFIRHPVKKKPRMP